MYKLSMIAISLLLAMASASTQASNDTSYLGMDGWRTTVMVDEEQEGSC